MAQKKTAVRKRVRKSARYRAAMKHKRRKRKERVSGHARVKGAKRNRTKARAKKQ